MLMEANKYNNFLNFGIHDFTNLLEEQKDSSVSCSLRFFQLQKKQK